MPTNNKKKTKSSSSAAADFPNWRQFLLNVPEPERCQSQKDMLRALEMVDRQLELGMHARGYTFSNPGTVDPGHKAACAAVAALEVDLLRLLDTASVVPLYPKETAPEISHYLNDMYLQDQDKLFKTVNGPLILTPVQVAAAVCTSTTEFLRMFTLAEPLSQMRGNLAFDNKLELWDVWNNERCVWEEVERARGNELLQHQDSILRLKDYKGIGTWVAVFCAAMAARDARSHSKALKAWDRLMEWMQRALDTQNPVILSAWTTWHCAERLMDLVNSGVGFRSMQSWKRPLSDDFRAEIDQRRHAAMRLLYEIGVKVMEEVENAVAEDPARLAVGSGKMAVILTNSMMPWYYTQVEDLLKKVEENMSKCKDWLPPLYRKLIKTQLIEYCQGFLDATKRKHPRDYKTVVLGQRDFVGTYKDVSKKSGAKAEKAARLMECACCGKTGRDLSLCAACKKVRYCSRECQKKDWKLGHKQQCKVLAAEGGGGESGEEED